MYALPIQKKSVKSENIFNGSKAECVMELESRRILYAYNADSTLPMASTTKILTAITAIENTPEEALKTAMPVPEEAVGIEGSSVYLKSGEIYSSEDLLYGLMLRSGNDCAVALALRTAGNVENFATMMNKTAQKAGAIQSCFLNPHGLPKKGHFTTARDLSIITCYALHNKKFAEIVSTKHYAAHGWENKNKMLRQYEGAIGVKTGYTVEAGRCLVSAATRNGMTLICTVLHCYETYARSASLLDDAFKAYENVKLIDKTTPFHFNVNGKNLSASTNEDVFYPLLPEEKGLIGKEIKPIENPTYTEKKSKIVGEIKIYLGNQLLFSKKLYKL